MGNSLVQHQLSAVTTIVFRIARVETGVARVETGMCLDLSCLYGTCLVVGIAFININEQSD